jgi:uncharacterized YigZ family protein
MQTVTCETAETLEVKRSKFIAHLVPYTAFDALLARLREEHPKARHFVTASRHLNDFDQVVEGCSDDGEPRGTSGKPTLAVLQGSDLINVGIVIVRYFGGIKLGTGGLVRAYGDAANLAIASAACLPYVKTHIETFACEYARMGAVEYAMGQHRITALQKQFDASEVIVEASGTREDLDAFFAEVGRAVQCIS